MKISNPEDNTFLFINVQVPGPPILHDVYQESSAHVTLSWDPPLQTNGNIELFYIDYRRASDTDDIESDDTWNQELSSTKWTRKESKERTFSIDLKCSLSDVKMTYLFKVSAVNRDENGVILQGEAAKYHRFVTCGWSPGKPCFLMPKTYQT